MYYDEHEPAERVFIPQRLRMVEGQIEARGVKDVDVLAAMRTVPRHLFVPERMRPRAYEDHALPIAEEQTISQPYIVASMTEHLQVDHASKVLEIGTGSGYQAAVLAEIVRHVYSVEIVPALYQETETRLKRLSYRNISLRLGDGQLGWPEEAPFDGIIVTAAAYEIPPRLLGQLRVGGRMIIPIDTGKPDLQNLVMVENTASGAKQTALYAVRFVPLVGGP